MDSELISLLEEQFDTKIDPSIKELFVTVKTKDGAELRIGTILTQESMTAGYIARSLKSLASKIENHEGILNDLKIVNIGISHLV